MNIHKLYDVIFRLTGTRRKRMALFAEVMGPTDDLRILDIGGTALNWRYLEARPQVLMLNKNAPSQDRSTIPDHIELMEGDATDLPFADGEFDIAFSNSVIEHLHTRENQQRFAAEAGRVAKRVWIQTPAREFFLEPHLITPFVHWLPDGVKRRIYRNGTVWGLVNRPSRAEVDGLVDELQLLGRADMEALFPDCELVVERWLGMPKSYIAHRS